MIDYNLNYFLKHLYFFSKLLPLIILPPSGPLLLLVIGIIRKSNYFISIGVATLFFSSLGITSEYLTKYVESPYVRLDEADVDQADAIVVLSGNREYLINRSKTVEWKDPDRFFAGVQLYKKKKSQKLIFTGGYSPFYSDSPIEGELNKKDAISFGIPSGSIFITNKAYNTHQEAIEVEKLLKKISPSKNNTILLVTSAFHMKRAETLFTRRGLIVKPFPVDFKSNFKHKSSSFKNPYLWIPNSSSLHSFSIGLREIFGRGFYRIF